MTAVTRRGFLRRSIQAGAGAALLPGVAALGGFSKSAFAQGDLRVASPSIDLAVARGDDPARNCMAALDALGGLGRFVQAGQKVVIKPNPVGNYPPERAINTHPEMVRVVVRECLRLGAKEVKVISHDEASSFVGTGLAKVIEGNGGSWKALRQKEEFREVLVPRARNLRTIDLAEDLLQADVFINMPIAKHHAGSQVTFSMKNLMGVNFDRLVLHRTDLQQGIAELASAVRHDLVIVDANHVLLTNGPVGPGQVLRGRQVIAATDPVAADAYCTRFFDLKPEAVGHIRTAYELGVGEMNLDRLKIREFDA